MVLKYRYHGKDDLSGKGCGCVHPRPTKALFRTGEIMLNTDMISVKKLDEWVNKSRKGEKLLYYRGFLFAPQMQKLSPTQDYKRVAKLRDQAHRLYNANLITMVQKRHDDFDYEYFAVRT